MCRRLFGDSIHSVGSYGMSLYLEDGLSHLHPACASQGRKGGREKGWAARKTCSSGRFCSPLSLTAGYGQVTEHFFAFLLIFCFFWEVLIGFFLFFVLEKESYVL
uniref:Uncharacterized protein n=1 Tax=Opuntia streptacantha TaxID=393608 RepID=A0A7C8YRK4_OPUST